MENRPSTNQVGICTSGSDVIQIPKKAVALTFKWLLEHAMHLRRRLRRSKGPMNMLGFGRRADDVKSGRRVASLSI